MCLCFELTKLKGTNRNIVLDDEMNKPNIQTAQQDFKIVFIKNKRV